MLSNGTKTEKKSFYLTILNIDRTKNLKALVTR